ncbi:MAG: GEVED domain-containing protein [candidate division KSB1 bacterium]|nr:GEVED domain-containing protein [candidate division KSB1 bacterium]
MVDTEGVYTGSLAADADDNNDDTNDEDGITFYHDYNNDGIWVEKTDNIFVSNYTYQIKVTVNLGSGYSALLAGWFDFSADGIFGNFDNEIIINNDLFQNGLGKTQPGDLSLAKTAATLTRYYTFTVPDIVGGDYTFIRFRLDTYTEGGGLLSSGFGAGYGEVEDYYATLDDTPPVSSQLTSFEAEQSEKGIRLFWNYENLQNLVGFNVLRSVEEAGQYNQINKSLLLCLEPNPQSFTFTDYDILKNKNYFYKLEALDLNGKSTLYGPVCAAWNTGIEEIPENYKFVDNYPNPFNSNTWFEYVLASAGHVKLRIYNIKGELVRTLVDSHQSKGSYKLKWNAENDRGRFVPTGIYIYQFQCGDYDKTGRMLYMK